VVYAGIFGPQREEEVGDRICHDEERYDLYASSNDIQVIKRRKK
jgi:hypothetical protein